ncbi:hypothetical protein [Sinosporangium siamense]|uniref:Uncharacterized protein n=1 Tax=Sinosporangium siamense TaxID=1367973 RepID=A0A919RAS5_9ACTN|nr:hypothetical protein [Sinosporangium siamense]GII90520.1 hypothetical protein Ssi02_07510 [Sinosporangium siamense]
MLQSCGYPAFTHKSPREPLVRTAVREPVDPDEHVIRYERTSHYFYVLADGNAVNFLHGASVGAFIYLVQGEIIAATARLTSVGHEAGMHELDPADRSRIAATWLSYFDGTS